MDYGLRTTATSERHIGRAAIFYKRPAWDGTTDLTLTHLGDTQGGVEFNRNAEYGILRATEVTGPAKLRVKLKGEDPVLTIENVWWGRAALLDLVTGKSSASGGFTRQRDPIYVTVWILPEEIFIDAETQLPGTLHYTSGGGWTFTGSQPGDTPEALTDEQDRLLAHSILIPKAYFDEPNIPFSDANAGEALAPVTINVVHNDGLNGAIPNGNLLYTIGDPTREGFDIEIDVS
jgi:hypothetical protein